MIRHRFEWTLLVLLGCAQRSGQETLSSSYHTSASESQPSECDAETALLEVAGELRSVQLIWAFSVGSEVATEVCVPERSPSGHDCLPVDEFFETYPYATNEYACEAGADDLLALGVADHGLDEPHRFCVYRSGEQVPLGEVYIANTSPAAWCCEDTLVSVLVSPEVPSTLRCWPTRLADR